MIMVAMPLEKRASTAANVDVSEQQRSTGAQPDQRGLRQDRQAAGSAGTVGVGFPRQPGIRPGYPPRHGPPAWRHAALQQLPHPAFAYRLRGLAGDRAAAPYGPAHAHLS